MHSRNPRPDSRLCPGGREQAWHRSKVFRHAPDSAEDPRNHRVSEGLPPRGFLPYALDASYRAIFSVPRSDPYWEALAANGIGHWPPICGGAMTPDEYPLDGDTRD